MSMATRKMNAGGVDAARLMALDVQLTQAEETVADARSEIAQVMEDLEALQVHQAAFRLAHKVRKMEPLKMQAFVRAFDAYCQAIGVHDQIDLFEMQSRADRDDEAVRSQAAD